MARKSDAYGRPKRSQSQIKPPRYRRQATQEAPVEYETVELSKPVNGSIEPWEILLLLFIAVGIVWGLIDVFMPG